MLDAPSGRVPGGIWAAAVSGDNGRVSYINNIRDRDRTGIDEHTDGELAGGISQSGRAERAVGGRVEEERRQNVGGLSRTVLQLGDKKKKEAETDGMERDCGEEQE